VSYASPAYYADRLCERGRCYLRDFFVNTNTPQAKTLRRNLRQTKHTQELQKAQSRITQFGPIWNNNVRRAKIIQEQVQEVNDRKDVIDACCNGIMIEAKKEFYKNGNGKNPWKKSIAHTMFWM
jgi:eukaryotic translation initiation factor 2C